MIPLSLIYPGGCTLPAFSITTPSQLEIPSPTSLVYCWLLSPPASLLPPSGVIPGGEGLTS